MGKFALVVLSSLVTIIMCVQFQSYNTNEVTSDNQHTIGTEKIKVREIEIVDEYETTQIKMKSANGEQYIQLKGITNEQFISIHSNLKDGAIVNIKPNLKALNFAITVNEGIIQLGFRDKGGHLKTITLDEFTKLADFTRIENQ